MIDLADTTFRAYKKKRGGVSLHLRSYLLVHTNVGFKLTAYLRDIRGWITLPGSKEEEIDSVAVSEFLVCEFSHDIMVHDLYLSTVIRGCDVKRCIADLRMMYHISFTGHPTEEPQFIQRKVLVIPHFYRKAGSGLSLKHLPIMQAYSLCGSENLSGVFIWISREPRSGKPGFDTVLRKDCASLSIGG